MKTSTAGSCGCALRSPATTMGESLSSRPAPDMALNVRISFMAHSACASLRFTPSSFFSDARCKVATMKSSFAHV